MNSTTQKPNHKFLIASLLLAVLFIASGTLFMLQPQLFSLNSAKQFTANLFGSNLIVKVDRTVLAANGTSQTRIVAEAESSDDTLKAEIVNGGGKIEAGKRNGATSEFIYTSGTAPAKVLITISGSRTSRDVELTLVEPVIPAIPQIVSPPDNSELTTPRPEISGIGPANHRIILSNNGAPNTITKTDDKGNFKVKLEKALANGQHSLSAIAVNDLDLSSPPSNLIKLLLRGEPLKVDTANIRFTPPRIIAGESFGLFVPASLNTEKVLVELEGKTYTMSDIHGSSIFNATLPAPTIAGAYSLNIILQDAGGAPTRFDGLIKINVFNRS